jgi:hypothetical protein
MSEQKDEMYVSRVLFRNGTIYNFLFSDPARCKSCTETLNEAKNRFAENKPASQHQAHVFDDAGREAFIDGGQIQACMTVVVGYEVYMNTRLAIYINRIEADLKEAAGVPTEAAPAQPAREEQPLGVIGRRAPEFAT